MSGDGFSTEWLALREPADHAARSPLVAAALRDWCGGRERLSIVDLGCGAGSNLRGAYRFLPDDQSWTLVDYDARLLAAASKRLSAWADETETQPDGALALTKDGKRIRVHFRQADLSKGASSALPDEVHLVTAAALFDLCAPDWLEGFADLIAARGLPLYTVLTYDGRDRFAPIHPRDGDMLAAFLADMRRDKGFGPSAGADAALLLANALSARGYRVASGDSPWVLDMADPLAIALAEGFATAVAASGRLPKAAVKDWLAFRLAGKTWETGHTDLFAIPL